MFAADLFNEPHGATWASGDNATDWDLAAARQAEAVLDECPRWLIFVEGVGDGIRGKRGAKKGAKHSAADAGAGDAGIEVACELCFWGENLRGLARTQLQIAPRYAERIVFSPHVYGPGTDSRMWYFDRKAFPSFPENMDAIWREHFVAPAAAAGATLVVGEWGGSFEGDDALWQEAFLRLLLSERLSSFYWSLNPNSADTGGLYLDDWTSPHQGKQKLLEAVPSSSVAAALASTPPFRCHTPLALHERDESVFRCSATLPPSSATPSRLRARALDAVRPAEAAAPNGSAVPSSPGLCVHLLQLCNGVPECADGSDELSSLCKDLGREPPCLTIDGPQRFRRCLFPFSYRGANYSKCAIDDTFDGTPWPPAVCTATAIRGETPDDASRPLDCARLPVRCD